MKSNKKTKYRFSVALVLIIFGASSVSANERKSAERLKFNLNMDEDNDLHPELIAPVSWSANLYSSIGFSQGSYFSNDVLDGFSDSKYGTIVEEDVIRFNILSHRSNNVALNYSIGGDYQYRSIEKFEFGYFYLNNGPIDDYVAFDNKIDIKVTGFAIRSDVTLGNRSDKSQFKISAIISPNNQLTVDQKTDFKPIVASAGVENSAMYQDLSYVLALDFAHNLTESIDLRVFTNYESLPLKYNLKVLASTAINFEPAAIDVTQVTTTVGFTLVFKKISIFPELYPTLGYKIEEMETLNNIGAGSDSRSNSLFSIGFTGGF